MPHSWRTVALRALGFANLSLEFLHRLIEQHIYPRIILLSRMNTEIKRFILFSTVITETSPGNVQAQPNSDSHRSSTSASGSESHTAESTSTSASSCGFRSSESTNSLPAQTDDTLMIGAEGPTVQDPAKTKIFFGSSSDYSKSLDGEDSEEEWPEWDKEDYLTPGSAQDHEMKWWETHEHLKRQWRKERATNPKFRGLARGQ